MHKRCLFCKRTGENNHRPRCPSDKVPTDPVERDNWIDIFDIGLADSEGVARPSFEDSFATAAYNAGFDMRNHLLPWQQESNTVFE